LGQGVWALIWKRANTNTKSKKYLIKGYLDNNPIQTLKNAVCFAQDAKRATAGCPVFASKECK